jgi:N-acetylneuraminic acid mutarotase
MPRVIHFRSLLWSAILLIPLGLFAQASWILQSTSPNARAQAAVAADTAGKIYVLGGWNNSTVFNTVDIYDTVSNTWSTGPAMPIATRGASAVYYNNHVYVVGGYDSGQINTIQILDLSNNTWTQASLPGGGWETTAAVVGSQIIIFGGESNIAKTFSFNPTNNSTASLANSPNNSRGSQALTVGNSIYLVGAEGPNYDPAATILDLYNPSNDTWSTTPADDPLARTQFAAGTDGRYLYIAGGSSALLNQSSPFYTSFVAYDTQADSWKTLTALPVGLRETSGVVLNNTFYVFGGNTASGASAALYSIQTIPEPSTLGLMALGLGGLIWHRRRAILHR